MGRERGWRKSGLWGKEAVDDEASRQVKRMPSGEGTGSTGRGLGQQKKLLGTLEEG